MINRRHRIKPFSAARRTRTIEYNKLKADMLRPGTPCAACWPLFHEKAKPASQLHHIRGRIGRLLAHGKFIIPICPTCHDYIHRHPAEAREAGVLAQPGEWNTYEP